MARRHPPDLRLFQAVVRAYNRHQGQQGWPDFAWRERTGTKEEQQCGTNGKITGHLHLWPPCGH